MVDPIVTKAVSTTQDRLIVPVTAVSQPAKAAALPSTSQSDTQYQTGSTRVGLAQLAADFGKTAPVDEKRVEEVKRAVRNGTYPIAPETIADRLLALSLFWSPKK